MIDYRPDVESKERKYHAPKKGKKENIDKKSLDLLVENYLDGLKEGEIKVILGDQSDYVVQAVKSDGKTPLFYLIR